MLYKLSSKVASAVGNAAGRAAGAAVDYGAELLTEGDLKRERQRDVLRALTKRHFGLNVNFDETERIAPIVQGELPKSGEDMGHISSAKEPDLNLILPHRELVLAHKALSGYQNGRKAPLLGDSAMGIQRKKQIDYKSMLCEYLKEFLRDFGVLCSNSTTSSLRGGFRTSDPVRDKLSGALEFSRQILLLPDLFENQSSRLGGNSFGVTIAKFSSHLSTYWELQFLHQQQTLAELLASLTKAGRTWLDLLMPLLIFSVGRIVPHSRSELERHKISWDAISIRKCSISATNNLIDFNNDLGRLIQALLGTEHAHLLFQIESQVEVDEASLQTKATEFSDLVNLLRVQWSTKDGYWNSIGNPSGIMPPIGVEKANFLAFSVQDSHALLNVFQSLDEFLKTLKDIVPLQQLAEQTGNLIALEQGPQGVNAKLSKLLNELQDQAMKLNDEVRILFAVSARRLRQAYQDPLREKQIETVKKLVHQWITLLFFEPCSAEVEQSYLQMLDSITAAQRGLSEERREEVRRKMQSLMQKNAALPGFSNAALEGEVSDHQQTLICLPSSCPSGGSSRSQSEAGTYSSSGRRGASTGTAAALQPETVHLMKNEVEKEEGDDHDVLHVSKSMTPSSSSTALPPAHAAESAECASQLHLVVGDELTFLLHLALTSQGMPPAQVKNCVVSSLSNVLKKWGGKIDTDPEELFAWLSHQLEKGLATREERTALKELIEYVFEHVTEKERIADEGGLCVQFANVLEYLLQ